MIAIIDFGSSKVLEILNCVEQLGFEGEIHSYNSKLKIQNYECDKVIFSGAPILLSQIEDSSGYVGFAKEVLDLDIPVLGICFGHQIIGMAHGAVCEMGQEDRAGQEINQLKKDPIFDGLTSSFEMQQDHCEYINVPEGFLHLADSEMTKNEVMKHESKPIYGCQFHPEVSGENGLRFIGNFLKIN